MTLRLLLAAIDEGNLAKVAAREHISLSAVSRRISDLEARLGVRLLHRHDRGVTPTAAVLMVQGRIRNVFSLLDQVVGDLREVRDGARGVVRLQTHLTATVSVLPERLASFKFAHPDIDVIFDEATSVDIVHAVQAGDCDVGLVSGTVDGGSLTLIPWGADELVVVMPRGHPLEAAQEIRFADLLGLSFIGMTQSTALQKLYREHAASLGRVLDERARVSTFEGVRALVSAGLGIGILPSEFLLPSPTAPAVAWRRLSEPWALRPLMICVRDLEETTAATRLLIDHLKATPQLPTLMAHDSAKQP